MRKALLIDLYALPEYDVSLALGYLKAFADAVPAVRAAWDVELLHLPVATPPEEVAAAVQRSGAPLVGFSCYSWNIREVERALTRLPAKGKPFVVLGGIEVTPDPEGYLKKNRNADMVVFGEGEETFRDVLLRLSGSMDSPMEGVAGVCWREGRRTRKNAPRPPIPDLATVPSPYLSDSYGPLLRNQDRVMVETARGCPYTCTFCFEPRGFARVRSFPAARVKEELACIVGEGVREVAFLDTNFNMDRRRAVEIWDYLRDLGGRVRYAFELRGELLDEAQARSLSGLDYFAEIGLQSIHKRSLDAVKRWYEPDRFAGGLRALLGAGIYRPCAASAHGGVAVDLMMGLPHETTADIFASFDFVFALAPSTVILTMTKILPGTELYDDAVKGKFRYEFDTGAQYEMTLNDTLSRKEIVDLKRFQDAVEFAYNRLHAVRTMAWVAGGLKVTPSEVFLDLGRRMVEAGRPAASLGVDDLSALLAALCRARGDERLAAAVGGRLSAENLLVVLQKNREARPSWWRNLLFRAGFQFLSRFAGLPPLPGPAAAPAPRGEEALAASA